MRNFSLLIGRDLSKISSRIGNVRSVTRRIWCNLSNQAVDSRWTGLWKKLNPISNVVGLFPLDENILYEVYIHILTLGISSERMFTVTCSLAPCPEALEIKKLWGRWVGGEGGWGDQLGKLLLLLLFCLFVILGPSWIISLNGQNVLHWNCLFFNWFSRLLKNYSVKFKRLMMVCYSLKSVNYNSIESSLGN